MSKYLESFMYGADNASKYAALLIAFSLPFSTSVMNMAVALAVLLVILGGRWQEKLAAVKNNPIVFWAMLFFALYLLGVFYSNASWYDRFHVLNKYNKFLLIPLLMPIFLTAATRKLTINTFMIAMVIVLVCSYVQYFNLPPFKGYGGFGPASPFKNHSSANLLMAFASYLWLLAAVSWKKYRWFCWLVAILMIVNVFFMSDGRVGYLIMLGLLPVFAYLRFSWWGLIAGFIVGLLLLFSAYHLSTSFKSRTENLVITSASQQDESAGIRKFQAKVAIAIVKLHPIMGVGTGGFAKNYQAVSPRHDYSDNVQSQYLQTWVELGTVGLIVLLLFLFQQFRWSFKLQQPYNAIALGLVVTQAIAFLTLAALMDTTESHLFVLFMALCFASLSDRNQHESK